MNATHKRRLLKLADMLEKVPPRKFEMGSFFASSRDGNEIAADEFNPHRCKTAACAMGWAYTDKSFRRAGLNLRPRSNDIVSQHSAKKVFGLSEAESNALFFFPGCFKRVYGSYNPFPKTVAKRIRKFVADGHL